MRSHLLATAALAALVCVARPAAGAEPIKRYGFAEALQRALERNPAAIVAQQEIARSQALVREARAPLLPQLTGNAVGTRIDHERVLGDRVVQGAASLSANLTLAVPIVAAQRWAAWSHADDSLDVTRASSADVRRALSVATARAYLAVIAQQRVLEATGRALATAQAHYDYSHARRNGGVGNRLDEVRAQQEMESTRAQRELALGSLARTQEALGVLLAEDGPVDAAAPPELEAPPPLAEALKEAPEKRTDVRALELRETAATHLVRDSWTDFMPTLGAQAVPFFQNPPTMTQPQTGWQAQLILSVPLYDGGYRYGARDEREALLAEASASLDGARRQAGAEVRTAYEQLERADAALEAVRRSAELARETLDLATRAYQAGATTNLEVIDAERRARDAETSVAVAEDAARQAWLDLLAAAGRFPPS